MEKRIKQFASALWQTFLSVVKILLKSDFRVRVPRPASGETAAQAGRKRELVILANGPSLTETVARHADFLDGKDLLAVNHCASSDLFARLKPQYYLLADPLFWIVPELKEKTFGALREKTTWPMYLFMPMRAWKDREWQKMLAGNDRITVVKYNSTPVEGFRRFCNRIYHAGLGMPRPHNVLIPSISMALRMHYDRIYLAGADHSWLPEITVNDQNEVLMHQKHFYDRGTSRTKTVQEEDLSTVPLYVILQHMSVAFYSYFILLDYARYEGHEVINITPGSYIDAFPRMKL